jgi:hypothetical protein
MLYANENNLKTAQELMRHSTPNVTMGVYAQAVTEAKRQAQERLASLILKAEPEGVPQSGPIWTRAWTQIGVSTNLNC